MNTRHFAGRVARRGLMAAALLVGLGLTGCDSIFDVENPNNIKQEDLERAGSVTAAINGAYATVARGVLGMWGPYSTVTDEITWIGSRDAWQQLDQGFLSDPFNEFSDDAFKVIAQGRWMADEAVDLARPFYDSGELANDADFARALIYSAIAYITVADQFDAFALSNRMEPAPAISPDAMDDLYATAIGRLDEAITVANAAGASDVATQARAIRARAHQSLAIWNIVNPSPSSTPAFVTSSAAAADAAAVLGAVDAAWTFDIEPGSRDVAVPFEVALAYNVNQRQELQLGPAYVNISAEDKTELDADDPIALVDPITGEDDPILMDRIDQFYVPNNVLVPYTVVSEDEMHLILAEHALAGGDTGGFQTHINHIRSQYDLPDWTPGSGVSAADMLMHSRQVVLFLQARRLSDLYRFGHEAPEWQASSPAASSPGTFFPITITEIRANCNLNPDAPC